MYLLETYQSSDGWAEFGECVRTGWGVEHSGEKTYMPAYYMSRTSGLHSLLPTLHKANVLCTCISAPDS